MSMKQCRYESNKKYVGIKGNGCGSVMSDTAEVDAIRSMSIEQLDAVVQLILLGDASEVPLDELTVGRWDINVGINMDQETQRDLSLIAALVYLSGRLADEIPSLKRRINDV